MKKNDKRLSLARSIEQKLYRFTKLLVIRNRIAASDESVLDIHNDQGVGRNSAIRRIALH